MAMGQGNRVRELPQALVEWIEKTAGGPAVSIERRRAGGSREGWWIDVRRPGGLEALYLRRDAGDGPLSGTRYSVEREARTIQALQHTGLIVPEIFGINDEHHSVLARRMPGQADFRSVAGTPAWEEVTRHYVEQLWRLHSLDPAELDLPDHPVPQRAEDHALFEVNAWEKIYRTQVSVREPLVDFGLRWLTHFAPRRVQKTVLVHGDAGPANFLFEGGRVTAMLDWELSHVGDPMEDIGGICVRGTWTPFGNLATWLAEYEKRSGLAIDFASVRYYMQLQYMRAAVGELVALEGHDPATDVTLNTMSLVLGMRGLCQIMARTAGLPEPLLRADTAGARSAFTPYFDALAQNAESLFAAELDDPYLAHRARQLAALARSLERAAALGPRFEAEELDELATLLGRRSTDLARAESELAEQIRTGAQGSEPELIAYLGRRCERKAAIFAPALGPLYANRPPTLEAP